MLHEVIELQKRAVDSLVQKYDELDEITFRAPTGSGKTYMMADFMNRILEENDDVVFLVSTLSKGDLATQNYNKFLEYSSKGDFPNLKSHLINTNIAGEERLFIPTNFNVYLLPRDLYKSGGKLMQGAMESFLNTLTYNTFFGGLEKRIILIKDECHIATNNLDSISDTYFDKVINFSATPNLRRGQNPDVEITDDEAVNASLIKRVELGDEEDTIGDALNKFEEVKHEYRNLLGVNPCLIIQISNKDKADYELNNVIFPELEKAEHQDLKWMLIVDKDINCDTNDVFKAKKMPVAKWKNYAKENTSTIDVIIFKMVISEGWDIPRACMLYQVRDTQSDQLDEQVMRRVRRNPRLMDFETLSEEAKKLATTAWIWGIMPEGKKKTYCVKLYDEPSDTTNEIKIKTTRLKPLTKKVDFDLETFISSQPSNAVSNDIFTLYRKISRLDEIIKDMCYDYSDSFEKWWKFAENIDQIKAENDKYVCEYEKSMEIVTDENGKVILQSLPLNSSYVDNGNYLNISDWVWRRRDGKDKFSFDSDAERQWATIIKDLTNISVGADRAIKMVTVGKKNPNAGVRNLFGNVEPDRLNESQKYLWAKNYVASSDIKFEYYLGGVHSSYPDFIMKDCFNRIHIFEVKSVNVASEMPAAFDTQQYIDKVNELKKCYKQASKLTSHIFYLPVLKDDVWQITQCINGEDRLLTKEQFVAFIKEGQSV